MKKYLVAGLCLVLMFFSTPHLLVLAEEDGLGAKHAIVIEASTGKILFEKDSQTPAEIASISKLISAYVIFEALEKKEISLNDTVAISDYPYHLTQSSELSNIPLEKRSYKLEELLHASLISSANSAMIALAEHVAGSEPAFVDRMNAKLAEWEITDAVLVNSTGVNNEDIGDNRYPNSDPTAENKVSAIHVAKIVRHLLLDYPQILEITSQSYYAFDGEYYYTTNKMLESGTHARPGVDGLKTGTSDKAGASFVATSNEHGMRLISVVLNATETNSDPDNRFVVTNELLAYAYENFSMKTLVEKGQAYHKSSVSLFNGKTATATAVAAEDLQTVVAKGIDEPPIAHFVAKHKTVDAPVQQGTNLGILTLQDTNLIGKGYVDDLPQVAMIAKSDTPTASWPISWWNHFVRYVNENL